MAHGKYPIGHPQIITKNISSDNISQYFGLIKCSILPPQDLLIPVLSSRLKNGKLVFSLCNTCSLEVKNKKVFSLYKRTTNYRNMDNYRSYSCT